MKKFFLGVATACVMLAAGASAAYAQSEPSKYNYTNYGTYVEFYSLDGNPNFTVFPRAGGRSCGGDNWRGFQFNLARDTSGMVWATRESCGRNIYVCVDVEDSEGPFNPQVCATLRD